MNEDTIPFRTIDWSAVPKTEYKGETGTSWWQTMEFKGLRIRIVEYGAGYKADHWCQKGHIVYCLSGEFVTEHQDSEKLVLSAGMSYIVSDDVSAHRSVSENGAKLLVIDGDFLNL